MSKKQAGDSGSGRGRRYEGSSGGEGARSGYIIYKDRSSGIRFVFKREPADPELLHIYIRHLTSPEDAIQTFFAAEPIWNEQRHRFETYSSTHGLFWFWLETLKVAMIISCFKLEGS